MNDQFLAWCDAQIAACQARCRDLRTDSRGDEARFEQIRANVYSIHRAVYATLHDKPDQLAMKLREIPAAWQASLAAAEQHGDAEKAHIERLKLSTAKEIQAALSNKGG